MGRRHSAGFSFVLLVLLATPTRSISGDSRLALRVTPKQAYVFIDGLARRDGGGSFRLSPGEHTLALHNYGYKSVIQNFTLAPGKVTRLKIALEPEPGEVSPPWGRIQFRGQPRSVVLLNGKSLDHFVGHVGEFERHIFGAGELLIAPGTHQVTVLRDQDNKETYSGSISVNPNEAVIINLNRNGEQLRKHWPRGESLKSLPRFRAGRTSTTVAVSPVTATFSATPAEINCGESIQLAWSTGGMTEAEISGIGSVPPTGHESVRPKSMAVYKFTASGPGGIAERTATVTVNKEVTASLNLAPEEVHYKRVGEKVDQESVNLSWSTSNAELVSINGEGSVNATRIGSVNATGTRTVQAVPERTEPGPVDENWTFTLTATNACGGSQTRTASVHLTGSVEKEKSPIEAALERSLAVNSVYFPTALPSERDPNGGLVPSQQRLLTDLASDFKKYGEFRPDAHLVLQAHADARGSLEYNKALSERRAIRVKTFLLEQGIRAANIEALAFGKERNLDKEAVRRLEEQDPNLSEQERQKILRDLRRVVLASNRRVDILLSTIRPQSTRFFPYEAADAKKILRDKAISDRPPKKARHKRQS